MTDGPTEDTLRTLLADQPASTVELALAAVRRAQAGMPPALTVDTWDDVRPTLDDVMTAAPTETVVTHPAAQRPDRCPATAPGPTGPDYWVCIYPAGHATLPRTDPHHDPLHGMVARRPR